MKYSAVHPHIFYVHIFFFAGSFLSELVLILRQVWVSCDWCCAANGADNFAAADASADEDTDAEDDGE